MPPHGEQRDLQVQLVAPRVWEPLVADAFGSLAERGPQHVRLAETILWTFHNRHVGITPWLVTQLVPVLLEPRAGSTPSGSGGERGWYLVLRRLVQEITPPNRGGVSMAQYHGGIALGASQTYTLLKVLLPLILAACTDIGRNYLFAGDDTGTSVTAEAYHQFMQQLATAILRRASSVPAPDDETGEMERDPFWYEPASTLSGLVRGGSQAGGRSRALPVVDPVDLGLLLRLRPRLTDSAWARRRRLSMPTSAAPGLRRRQEGYVGIHITHRDEDLPAMLLSELIMPKLVRLDRLLNSGYFALERTPRRQRVRDVLVVGMLPPSLAGRAGGDFVKACWVDCQLRLSTLLRQHRLLNSELRWIEGDTFDRFRLTTFHLDDIPLSDPSDTAVEMSQGRREGLLSAMGWLPDIVDERAHYQSAGRPDLEAEEVSVPSPPDPLSRLRERGGHVSVESEDGALLSEPAGRSVVPEWVTTSWRAQQPRGLHAEYTARYQARRQRARNGRPAGSGAAAEATPVDSFAYVHVMLFLPASLRPGLNGGLETAGSVIGELRSRLGLGSRPDRHVSITWVPEDLGTPTDWVVDARGRIGQVLADPDEPDLAALDEHELAGRLVTTWLRQITEDLSGG
ncbi:MAG: hypothetical protein AB7P40_03365 [Chloroflexota bacterium]